MSSWLERQKERWRQWVLLHAHRPHAAGWLAAVAFAEASFFMVPPDLMLIAILLAGGRRWWQYALFTTFASVAGGLFGYAIGFWFFDLVGQRLVEFYQLQETMTAVGQLFNANALAAIFLASFTPIPYKVFTIAAGLFQINLTVFLLASLAGRGLRFVAVAYLVRVYGNQLSRWFDRYFNWWTLAIGLFLVFLFTILV